MQGKNFAIENHVIVLTANLWFLVEILGAIVREVFLLAENYANRKVIL